jgi:hypothetical protein
MSIKLIPLKDIVLSTSVVILPFEFLINNFPPTIVNLECEPIPGSSPDCGNNTLPFI